MTSRIVLEFPTDEQRDAFLEFATGKVMGEFCTVQATSAVWVDPLLYNENPVPAYEVHMDYMLDPEKDED